MQIECRSQNRDVQWNLIKGKHFPTVPYRTGTDPMIFKEERRSVWSGWGGTILLTFEEKKITILF